MRNTRRTKLLFEGSHTHAHTHVYSNSEFRRGVIESTEMENEQRSQQQEENVVQKYQNTNKGGANKNTRTRVSADLAGPSMVGVRVDECALKRRL